MYQKNRGRRIVAAVVAFVFATTNCAWSVPASGGDMGAAQTVAATASQTAGIAIPNNLGEIQVKFRDPTSDKTVILIQDAHAINEAQENIQKLIEYLQKNHGIQLVALEGGKEKLDPTLYRAFPDAKVMKKVMTGYLEQAELTGPEMAAILGEKENNFYGVEDWGLYEQNYRAYLGVQAVKEDLLKSLASFRFKLDQERRSAYSQKLNNFHEAWQGFRSERISVLDLFIAIGALRLPTLKPSDYPELSKVMESVGYERSGKEKALEPMIRAMANEFKMKYVRELGVKEEMNFYGKYQAFSTGKLSAGQFLLYMVQTGEAKGFKPKLTPQMRKLLGHTETLSEIKGSRLFDELQKYLPETMAALAEKPEERELAKKYERLFILEDLVKLELTHQELQAYQEDPESFAGLLGDRDFREKVKPALEFYEHALARDRAFFDRLTSLMNKEGQKTAVMVAGGFHTEGLKKILRANGVSHLVITPRIHSLTGYENYARVMKGDVSYKPSPNATLYDAFARAAMQKLLMELPLAGLDRNLKSWRDQLIRNAAAKGTIADVGQYTRYIDALALPAQIRFGQAPLKRSKEEIIAAIQKELERFRDESLAGIWKRFEAQLQEFGTGLRELVSKKELNLQTVSALLDNVSKAKPSMIPPQRPLEPGARSIPLGYAPTGAISVVAPLIVAPAIEKPVSELPKVRDESSEKTSVDRRAEYLTSQLGAEGFLSDLMPLFDLQDPVVEEAYKEALANQPSNAISRDITSWAEIESAVSAHLRANPGPALIIVEGAAQHIWGALPALEANQQVRYVSSTVLKLTAEKVRAGEIFKDKKTDLAVQETLKVQLRRTVGVAKYLGYGSLEEFVEDRQRRTGSNHLMIGLEETGLHHLYAGDVSSPVYALLSNLLDQYKPASVLYIHENLYVENMQKSFANGFPGQKLPRDEFLLKAKAGGVKVDFAAFGWKDREGLDRFDFPFRAEIRAGENLYEAVPALGGFLARDQKRVGPSRGGLVAAGLAAVIAAGLSSKKISRRAFLKIVGLASAGAAVGFLGAGCETTQSNVGWSKSPVKVPQGYRQPSEAEWRIIEAAWQELQALASDGRNPELKTLLFGENWKDHFFISPKMEGRPDEGGAGGDAVQGGQIVTVDQGAMDWVMSDRAEAWEIFIRTILHELVHATHFQQEFDYGVAEENVTRIETAEFFGDAFFVYDRNTNSVTRYNTSSLDPDAPDYYGGVPDIVDHAERYGEDGNGVVVFGVTSSGMINAYPGQLPPSAVEEAIRLNAEADQKSRAEVRLPVARQGERLSPISRGGFFSRKNLISLLAGVMLGAAVALPTPSMAQERQVYHKDGALVKLADDTDGTPIMMNLGKAGEASEVQIYFQVLMDYFQSISIKPDYWRATLMPVTVKTPDGRTETILVEWGMSFIPFPGYWDGDGNYHHKGRIDNLKFRRGFQGSVVVTGDFIDDNGMIQTDGFVATISPSKKDKEGRFDYLKINVKYNVRAASPRIGFSGAKFDPDRIRLGEALKTWQPSSMFVRPGGPGAGIYDTDKIIINTEDGLWEEIPLETVSGLLSETPYKLGRYGIGFVNEGRARDVPTFWLVPRGKNVANVYLDLDGDPDADSLGGGISPADLRSEYPPGTPITSVDYDLYVFPPGDPWPYLERIFPELKGKRSQFLKSGESKPESGVSRQEFRSELRISGKEAIARMGWVAVFAVLGMMMLDIFAAFRYQKTTGIEPLKDLAYELVTGKRRDDGYANNPMYDIRSGQAIERNLPTLVRENRMRVFEKELFQSGALQGGQCVFVLIQTEDGERIGAAHFFPGKKGEYISDAELRQQIATAIGRLQERGIGEGSVFHVFMNGASEEPDFSDAIISGFSKQYKQGEIISDVTSGYGINLIVSSPERDGLRKLTIRSGDFAAEDLLGEGEIDTKGRITIRRTDRPKTRAETRAAEERYFKEESLSWLGDKLFSGMSAEDAPEILKNYIQPGVKKRNVLLNIQYGRDLRVAVSPVRPLGFLTASHSDLARKAQMGEWNRGYVSATLDFGYKKALIIPDNARTVSISEKREQTIVTAKLLRDILEKTGENPELWDLTVADLLRILGISDPTQITLPNVAGLDLESFEKPAAIERGVLESKEGVRVRAEMRMKWRERFEKVIQNIPRNAREYKPYGKSPGWAEVGKKVEFDSMYYEVLQRLTKYDGSSLIVLAMQMRQGSDQIPEKLVAIKVYPTQSELDAADEMIGKNQKEIPHLVMSNIAADDQRDAENVYPLLISDWTSPIAVSNYRDSDFLDEFQLIPFEGLEDRYGVPPKSAFTIMDFFLRAPEEPGAEKTSYAFYSLEFLLQAFRSIREGEILGFYFEDSFVHNFWCSSERENGIPVFRRGDLDGGVSVKDPRAKQILWDRFFDESDWRRPGIVPFFLKYRAFLDERVVNFLETARSSYPDPERLPNDFVVKMVEGLEMIRNDATKTLAGESAFNQAFKRAEVRTVVSPDNSFTLLTGSDSAQILAALGRNPSDAEVKNVLAQFKRSGERGFSNLTPLFNLAMVEFIGILNSLPNADAVILGIPDAWAAFETGLGDKARLVNTAAEFSRLNTIIAGELTTAPVAITAEAELTQYDRAKLNALAKQLVAANAELLSKMKGVPINILMDHTPGTSSDILGIIESLEGLRQLVVFYDGKEKENVPGRGYHKVTNRFTPLNYSGKDVNPLALNKIAVDSQELWFGITSKDIGFSELGVLLCNSNLDHFKLADPAARQVVKLIVQHMLYKYMILSRSAQQAIAKNPELLKTYLEDMPGSSFLKRNSKSGWSVAVEEFNSAFQAKESIETAA